MIGNSRVGVLVCRAGLKCLVLVFCLAFLFVFGSCSFFGAGSCLNLLFRILVSAAISSTAVQLSSDCHCRHDECSMGGKIGTNG